MYACTFVPETYLERKNAMSWAIHVMLCYAIEYVHACAWCAYVSNNKAPYYNVSDSYCQNQNIDVGKFAKW